MSHDFQIQEHCDAQRLCHLNRSENHLETERSVVVTSTDSAGLDLPLPFSCDPWVSSLTLCSGLSSVDWGQESLEDCND